MTKTTLGALAAGTLLLVPAIALAQEPTPDTTPPSAVLTINTTLNSIDSMYGSGLTFSADPSEDSTWTAKATIKVKKKTVVVAKSIRTGDFYNQAGGFIEANIPDAGSKAEKAMRSIKKGKKTAVTLTISLTDTAGNKSTVAKTVKLKKRY